MHAPKHCLVGIDSCGTNMKVGVFSQYGERLYITSRKNIPIVTNEGHFYFDWRYQKQAILEMLQEVVAKGFSIASIGITSCGESVYPLDKEGNILDNAIAWYDRRTDEQKKEWDDKVPEKEAYKICYLKSFYSYSAHKMNWYKRHKPATFHKAVCWLPVNGFVNYVLTNTRYCDYNQAGTTMLFDINKRAWSDELIRLTGIPSEVLPELIENGRVTGWLLEENRTLLGVNYAIPVSLAGHDSWCGSFAMGEGISTRTGDCILSTTGTAGSVLFGMTIDENTLRNTDVEYFYTNFKWVIPSVYPNMYHCYWGSGVDYYGALIEFAIRLLYGKRAEDVSVQDYIRLQERVESSRPGANGVRLYVAENETGGERYLEGINILNMRITNTADDVCRAVMEYLCVNDRKRIMEISRRMKVNELDRRKMLVAGGLTNSRSFMKMRANILGRSQYICKEQELNVFGAALLGGVGAGIYKDHKEAVDVMGLPYCGEISPDEELAKEYLRLYK